MCVADGPPVKHSRDIKRKKIGERPLGFGPVVNLDVLLAARSKLDTWDSAGNKTRRRKRIRILYGLLQSEDGSLFIGEGGTARNGESIAYYKNRKHKVTIRADEIEQKVVDALSCYQDDSEVQSYVASAVKEFSRGVDAIDGQIVSLRKELKDLKEREAGLSGALIRMEAKRAKDYLEGQLNEIDSERSQLEMGVERLQREKTAIQSDMPNTQSMRATLEFVFKNFEKAEGAVKRNFMRQVFEKIVVFRALHQNEGHERIC